MTDLSDPFETSKLIFKTLPENIDVGERYSYSLLKSEYYHNIRLLTELTILNISPSDENKQKENVRKFLPINIIKQRIEKEKL